MSTLHPILQSVARGVCAPGREFEFEKQRIQTVIGSLARQARQAKRWTQEDVAERVGVTSEFYARVERGSVMPGLSTFIKIADLFGITCDALMGLKPPGEITLQPDPDPRRFRKQARRLRRARPYTICIIEKVVTETENCRRRKNDDD